MLTDVNHEPQRIQQGWLDVPAAALGAGGDGPFDVCDLLTDEAFTWTGDRHYVRLDPAERPAHILTLVSR